MINYFKLFIYCIVLNGFSSVNAGSFDDFFRAIKLDEYDPRAYFHRALLYFQLDKKDKGCADLDQADLLGFGDLYNADELSAARDLNCKK